MGSTLCSPGTTSGTTEGDRNAHRIHPQAARRHRTHGRAPLRRCGHHHGRDRRHRIDRARRERTARRSSAAHGPSTCGSAWSRSTSTCTATPNGSWPCVTPRPRPVTPGSRNASPRASNGSPRSTTASTGAHDPAARRDRRAVRDRRSGDGTRGHRLTRTADATVAAAGGTWRGQPRERYCGAGAGRFLVEALRQVQALEHELDGAGDDRGASAIVVDEQRPHRHLQRRHRRCSSAT